MKKKLLALLLFLATTAAAAASKSWIRHTHDYKPFKSLTALPLLIGKSKATQPLLMKNLWTGLPPVAKMAVIFLKKKL